MSVTEKLGTQVSPINSQQPSIINQQIPPDEVTSQFVQVRKTMEKGDQQTKNLGTALTPMVLRASLNVGTDLEATTDLFLMTYDIADQKEQQKARDTVNPFLHATRKNQIETSLTEKEVKNGKQIQLETLDALRESATKVSKDITSFTNMINDNITSIVTYKSITHTQDKDMIAGCFDKYCIQNSNFVITANKHIDTLREEAEKIEASETEVAKVLKDLFVKNDRNRALVEDTFLVILPKNLTDCNDIAELGAQQWRWNEDKKFKNQSIIMPNSNEKVFEDEPNEESKVKINIDHSNVNTILSEISLFNQEVHAFKVKLRKFRSEVSDARNILLNDKLAEHKKTVVLAKTFPAQNEKLKNEWREISKKLKENNIKLENAQKFFAGEFTQMRQNLTTEQDAVILHTNNHVTACKTFAEEKELTAKEELKLLVVEVKK